MKAFKKLTGRFVRDESGASLVEYSAALAVILIVAIVTLLTLGNTVSSIFTEANTQLSAALP